MTRLRERAKAGELLPNVRLAQKVKLGIAFNANEKERTCDYKITLGLRRKNTYIDYLNYRSGFNPTKTLLIILNLTLKFCIYPQNCTNLYHKICYSHIF